MPQLSKIALVREMLESAEASIRSAKQLLKELGGGNGTKTPKEIAMVVSKPTLIMGGPEVGPGTVIEGTFDGQNMIAADGRSYPVQANYASKSKLIIGDMLKLTIGETGTFMYKQIGPVPRRQIIGTLGYEDGQYKVLAEGRVYKVLLASVTYYKAEVGDRVTLIVPESRESEWGAIDNILPSVISNEELEKITKEGVTVDLESDEL